MTMEKLNQDSEWPKKNVGGIEISEKEKDEWPGDYFECLKPVFQLSDSESSDRVNKHLDTFNTNHDKKEFQTLLLLEARRILKYKFGFSELALFEIGSLVEISGRLVEQLKSDKDIEDFLSIKNGSNKFSTTWEVVEVFLIECYGIDKGAYELLSNKWFYDKREEGLKLDKALENSEERWQEFYDYVRIKRDKALTANLK
jgi:hypothetical protein